MSSNELTAIAFDLYKNSCNPGEQKYETFSDLPVSLKVFWRQAAADTVRNAAKTTCTEEDLEDVEECSEEFPCTPGEDDVWQFYLDKAEEWRWRRIAPNNEIVGASSEGYSSYAGCVNNAVRHGYVQYVDSDIEAIEKEAQEYFQVDVSTPVKGKPHYLYRVLGWFIILTVALVALPVLFVLVLVCWPILPWFAPYDDIDA